MITLDAISRERIIRLSPSVRDHLLLTLWFTVTFKQFRFDELLLYPLALYFGWAFVRDYSLIEPILRRSVILLAFPTWCMLTLIWAVEPGSVVKSGLQMFVTVIICYCAVSRLTPPQVVLSLAIASLVFALLSYPYVLSGYINGVFASKNRLGASMVLCWASSLYVFLDPRFARLVRAAALAAALLALILVFASYSATAVIMSAGTGLVLVTGKVLMSDGSLFRPGRLGTVFLALGVVFACLCVFAGNLEDPVAFVLDYFGKDTTLTGRTVLWQYAEEEIAKHPILGVGAGGYWNFYESPTVRRIFLEFDKPPYATFSFHSSWYEIALHQGLIGAGIAALTLFWAVWTILRCALLRGGLPYMFFTCIVIVVVSRSFTESFLMTPFAQLTMLLWIGALFATKERVAVGNYETARTGGAVGVTV